MKKSKRQRQRAVKSAAKAHRMGQPGARSNYALKHAYLKRHRIQLEGFATRPDWGFFYVVKPWKGATA